MFRHIINAIFFWQLVNKTADGFNNIVFILEAKISSIKVCEKMENNSTLERALVTVSSSIFWFQSGFPQKDEEEKFDNFEKFANFCFICLSLLTFELSNINWKCSENCNMLTKRTYDSAIFKIFLNIITICIVIEQ